MSPSTPLRIDRAPPGGARDGPGAELVSAPGPDRSRHDAAPKPLARDVLLDLLDHTGDAIIVRDMNDRIVFWNRDAERLYGWSQSAALGRVAHELLQTRLPDDPSDASERFRRDGSWEGPVTQVTRDGRTLVVASHWWRRRGSASDGSCDLVLETNRNATEAHEQAERTDRQAPELEQSIAESRSRLTRLQNESVGPHARTAAAEAAERQLTPVLESLPDAATLYDQDWRMLYANSASAAEFRAAGYDPETLIGRVVWEALPELVGTRTDAEMRRAATERRSVTFEERSPLDGRWFETRVVPTASGAVLLRRDISELRSAEAEQAQLAAIVATSDDAIISKDLDGTILSWNAGATRLFGYEPHEIIGRSILLIVPAFKEAEETEILSRLRRGERIEHFETVRRRKDGRLVHISLSISPVRDRSGAIASVAKIARDITAQRRADEELAHMYDAEREARKAAEAANHAKFEFLATMSHELRTPLNAISGYVELIDLGLHGPVTEQQREDLARIQRSQQHLLGLINDVLNFVRLDTNHVHFDLRVVEVGMACRGVEDLVLPQLRARGLHYERRACDPHLSVRADPDKLRQILVNLLSNATKYTESGGQVEVSCQPNGDRVRILVRDTGIGIPAERLADIFEPFVQVGRQLNRPSEGIGLGLAISRELARAMTGDLTVESTLGAGSTFTLTLPRGERWD